MLPHQGRIQDFKLEVGAYFQKLLRAEGGAKIVGVFRVKNYDFTPKNHIFSNFRRGARRVRPPPSPGSAPAHIDFIVKTCRHMFAYRADFIFRYVA